MQRKQLISKLNTLCNTLEAKYEINHGGCCFLAYLISRWLEKLNIPYSLTICDYVDKNKDELQNQLSTRELNDSLVDSLIGEGTASHYYISTKYGDINSEDKDDLNIYSLDANSEDIEWIYDHGSWNSQYNTNFNEDISNIINNFFKSLSYEKK